MAEDRVSIPDLPAKLRDLLADEDAAAIGQYERANQSQFAAKLEIKRRTFVGWLDDAKSISTTVNQRIADLFHFDVDWPPWLTGDIATFKAAWDKHGKKTRALGPSSNEPIDQFDDMLATISLWFSQDKTTDENGEDLWPISFSLSSQPSPSIIDRKLMVLSRVQVFIQVQREGTIWHESYPAKYELGESNVTLSKIGGNRRPGRLIEAAGTRHIESIDLPHDFYRLAGLQRGDLIRVSVAAYKKDIAVASRHDQSVGPDTAGDPGPHDDAQDEEEEPLYSFRKLKGGETAELTSTEQERLLHIIDQKQRQMRMNPDLPKAQDGWLVLHWEVREHAYAASKSNGGDQ